MSSIAKSTRAKIASILGFDFVHVSTGKFFTNFPDKRKKRYTVRNVTDNTLSHLLEYEDGSIKAVTAATNIDLNAQPNDPPRQFDERTSDGCNGDSIAHHDDGTLTDGTLTDGTLTHRQFTALAKLLQSRHGPAEHAARLVLVNDICNADAARAAKLTPAQSFNAVTRYRRAYALTLIVAGRTPSVEISTPPVRGNTEGAGI